MNVLLDIEQTPILKMLEINGRLTFSNAINVELRSKIIFVRAGELIIGSETNAYPKIAKITLYGMRNDQTMAYDNWIEAGNKLIANVGLIKMYGGKRKQTLMRL